MSEPAIFFSNQKITRFSGGQSRIDYYGFTGEVDLVCARCGQPSRSEKRETLFQIIEDGRITRAFRCKCGQVLVIEGTGPMWKQTNQAHDPIGKGSEEHP